MHTRRKWLLEAAALAAAFPRAALPQGGASGNPFTLGVASGYPTPGGVVLWTRLAPQPYAPGGGMQPLAVKVAWEVADDEQFSQVRARGTSWADPRWGHAVHVEVPRLEPDRWYFYRFHAGDVTSPVGRTRTAPVSSAMPARLRFACASCQHFEHGYFAAYRHMLGDELDLIVHLGDYIYESSWGPVHVRDHEAGREPVSLDDYRARYARYRSDPDLQAAHAACPWLVTWDDHEVDNDYAAAQSQDKNVAEWFLARRAAAYQAYYEHMPLPRQMLPAGPHMPLHAGVNYGQLARFYLLDDRQYRSPQPCPYPGRGGGNRIDEYCKERLDPGRTMLGARQEAWLDAYLAFRKPRWNLLAQQTLIAAADSKPGAGEEYYSDGWNGYPVARDRMLESISSSGAQNPVTFGGDVHSFWATDLKADFARPESTTIATEFVTTSISSNPLNGKTVDKIRAENPHIRYASGGPRGYLRVQIEAAAMTVDMRELDDVRKPDSGCHTLRQFVVEDGRTGAQES